MAGQAKPTKLRIIEGNRGKRPINKLEPDPDVLQDLTPPAWIPDAAKGVWRELAPGAAQSQLLTVVDVEPFAQLCVAIAAFRTATENLGDELVTTSEKGQEYLNPWSVAQAMASKQCNLLFAKFGFTPHARTQISLPTPPKKGKTKEDDYFS